MPIFLCLFILFGIWLSYERSKHTKITKEASETFWQRENEANFARRKDISKLPYITIDFHKLPSPDQNDEQICTYYTTLNEINQSKILNLSSLSNTDLKITYGQANFDLLSIYDQNYTTMIVNLNKWGNYLYEKELYEEAVSVYEYAVEVGSDISTTYITLAKIYLDHNNFSQFQTLCDKAKEVNSLMKSKINKSLEQLKFEYVMTNDHIEI